ncbi:uncharacterized protein BO66DRAFT_255534 [Aspergillus aculeatinus CBS 121060]|uniref:Uncharacterized protein n=1 Tax=Aspergillus aculeatinus CBS 121060 TaxID=1448322 RepID=A0ACD1GRW3_9EURO|nr:hypothetical protein BO66DRAFT_255534 [Aspergillus aculeatinus CBS 121060]RAH64018.1 hypothetical protein BO66DRAFT_255534 [Aspergillus aculeatinus CBS 121060]
MIRISTPPDRHGLQAKGPSVKASTADRESRWSPGVRSCDERETWKDSTGAAATGVRMRPQWEIGRGATGTGREALVGHELSALTKISTVSTRFPLADTRLFSWVAPRIMITLRGCSRCTGAWTRAAAVTTGESGRKLGDFLTSDLKEAMGKVY